MEQEPEKNPSSQKNALKSLGLFFVVLTDLVGYTGVGVAIGYYLWAKQGAPWWVLLLTSMLGLGLAFYQVYIVTKNDI